MMGDMVIRILELFDRALICQSQMSEAYWFEKEEKRLRDEAGKRYALNCDTDAKIFRDQADRYGKEARRLRVEVHVPKFAELCEIREEIEKELNQ